MSYQREEFIASIKKAAKVKRLDTATVTAEHTHQAAVEASTLMEAPEWHVYQQQLAGAIEKIAAHEETVRARLCDPGCVRHEDLMVLKLTLAEIVGTRQGLETALSLPKLQQEDAEKADELLAELLSEQRVVDDKAA